MPKQNDQLEGDNLEDGVPEIIADDPNPATPGPQERAQQPQGQEPAGDADEPPQRPLSAREQIAQRYAAKKRGEVEEGDGVTIGGATFPAETEAGDDEPPAPAAAVAPEPKPEPRRVKLKVDGRELDLPEEEVVAIAQQNIAASNRLQEANRLTDQARRDREEAARLLAAAREAVPQPAQAEPAPKPEKAPKEALKTLVERIRFGEDDDAAEALLQAVEVVAGDRQQGAAPVDVESVVEQRLSIRDEQRAIGQALEGFAERHKDIVEDDDLFTIAMNNVVAAMQKDMLDVGATPDQVRALRNDPYLVARAHRDLRRNGFAVRTYDQVLDDAATKVREKFRPAAPTPTPTPTPDTTSRLEMKRGLAPQPRTASVKVNLAPAAPPSRKTVIAEIRRSRGQPVA